MIKFSTLLVVAVASFKSNSNVLHLKSVRLFSGQIEVDLQFAIRFAQVI